MATQSYKIIEFNLIYFSNRAIYNHQNYVKD